jgi:putative transposase
MRKPRELCEGARYHVTSRANRQEMILDPEETKELFLSVVRRAKRKYSFRLENFCIMGTHFHFVIQPGKGECLSSIMRWILSVFAMAYNRARRITGHVWGQRFFSRIIACLRELVDLFDYIDANPVRANLVSDRRDWRFGGLWHDRCASQRLTEEPQGWMLLVFPGRARLMLR